MPTFISLLFNSLFIVGLIGEPVSLATQGVSIDVKVILEGPYDAEKRKMSTKLYELGYLPGMEPKAFFAEPVPFFDPYADTDTKNLKNNINDASVYTEQTVDWLYMSIKDEDSGVVVFKRSVLLNSDGSITVDPIPLRRLIQDHTYTISIGHRNHLSIRSEKISIEDGKLAYDFTKESSLGAKSKGKVKMMVAGNLNSTLRSLEIPTINNDDIETWRRANGNNSSYLIEDIDLNGDVSVHDQSIILENLDTSTPVIINE